MFQYFFTEVSETCSKSPPKLDFSGSQNTITFSQLPKIKLNKHILLEA